MSYAWVARKKENLNNTKTKQTIRHIQNIQRTENKVIGGDELK